jgi:hypothetical protein
MKSLCWLPVIVVGALLVRRFHPEMGKVCQRMFEKMPDEFPPKWMYLNIMAIREQNERIIHLLEEQSEAHH